MDALNEIKELKCQVFDLLVQEDSRKAEIQQLTEQRSKVLQQLSEVIKKYNDEMAKNAEVVKSAKETEKTEEPAKV